MKRKPIYIIQIYRRVGKDKNEPLDHIFGGFSTCAEAETWIKLNRGSELNSFIRGYKREKLFFAILEVSFKGVFDHPIAHKAIDLDGKLTSFFKGWTN